MTHAENIYLETSTSGLALSPTLMTTVIGNGAFARAVQRLEPEMTWGFFAHTSYMVWLTRNILYILQAVWATDKDQYGYYIDVELWSPWALVETPVTNRLQHRLDPFMEIENTILWFSFGIFAVFGTSFDNFDAFPVVV
jgi:hypothetical protein